MKHGTYIANLAYEQKDYEGKYEKIGTLLYYRGRHPSAKMRIDHMFPPEKKIIGLFLKDSEVVQEKFDGEAPMVEGDLFARICGEAYKCGHIHSSQNEVGDTMYFAIFDVDISLMFKAHNRIFGSPPKCFWLEVEME